MTRGARGTTLLAMRTLLAALLALLCVSTVQTQRRPRVFVESDRIKLFELESELLTAFWGRSIKMQAGVVLPTGWDQDTQKRWPVCYDIHGFGGSHTAAMSRGRWLLRAMDDLGYPQMLYVYLNASCPQGHHEFADSVNNGPWGKALTQEFVPALEKAFHGHGAPQGRFLTGHSSGGWSSFWLQVSYPEFFGGTWSTAPDSVDFRDFTGIDIYSFANAYTDPRGKEIPLMRRGTRWIMSIRDYVQKELWRKPYGGQFSSFDYVFSPRGPDGRPMPLFDRKTGKIDEGVAEYWKRYDIGLILRENWERLGPKLGGKLHLYMGTLDTFRLEGAARLLKKDLAALGSDAEILLVEGRDHGSLFRPHPEHWPEGLLKHIHVQMRRRFDEQAK